ncbi:MAG: hypothetical protein PHR06_12730, partial [Candidatus Cloacimonetes bacterium]|nr:hypothetical protein [Candidatus Cloacimonadota bacterium]
MLKQFSKLSEIKNMAKAEVDAFINSLDKGNKIINSIMGAAATNKNWLTEAKSNYQASLQKKGFNKVNYLIAALFNIYKCEFRMKFSPYNDDNIMALRIKYETAYMNYILDFIETHTENNSLIQKHQELLVQAIQALAEENQKMAQHYSAVVQRSLSGNDLSARIRETLNLPVADFNVEQMVKIKNLTNFNEDVLKKHPEFYAEISGLVQMKLNEILDFYKNKIDQEENKTHPSLVKILSMFDYIKDLYAPVRHIVSNKAMESFLEKREEYGCYEEFLQKDYPELKAMFGYLAFPRRKIDTQKITALMDLITKKGRIISGNYLEFTELSPSLSEISTVFENAVRQYLSSELADYYRLYNQILNSSQNDEKILEIVKFYQYIGTTIIRKKHPIYISEKLASIRDDLLRELNSRLSDKLEQKLKSAVDLRDFKKAFDDVFDIYLNSGLMEEVDELRQKKATLLLSMDKLSHLQKILSN